MAQFLWEEPEPCEDYGSGAQPDGMQQAWQAASSSSSSAPAASQWIANAIDIQTRAAQWRKLRDEHSFTIVDAQERAAEKIKRENARWREEERCKKGKGAKDPDMPGKNTCPECGRRTWDLMTLGTCDQCGLWNALWDKKNFGKRKKKPPPQNDDDEKEPYVPGPRFCPECKKRTWDLMTLGTCDACGSWNSCRDSFNKHVEAFHNPYKTADVTSSADAQADEAKA